MENEGWIRLADASVAGCLNFIVELKSGNYWSFERRSSSQVTPVLCI
jgi:hypothetical protein